MPHYTVKQISLERITRYFAVTANSPEDAEQVIRDDHAGTHEYFDVTSEGTDAPTEYSIEEDQ